jgi:hypothetical protein
MNTNKLENNRAIPFLLISASSIVLISWYIIIVAEASSILFQLEFGFIDYRVYHVDYLILISAFLFGCFISIKNVSKEEKKHSIQLYWVPVSVTIFLYLLYAVMSSLFN